MSTDQKREELKLALRGLRFEENAKREEEAALYIANNSQHVRQLMEQEIKQLNARQIATLDATRKVEADAKAARESQLETQRNAREEAILKEKSEAAEAQKQANEKRKDIEEEIKTSKSERAHTQAMRDKMAVREQQRIEAQKEVYEFRVFADAKTHSPLPRDFVNQGSKTYTLVTIDVYEEKGYIAYNLVSPKPEIIDSTTTVRAPNPFVLTEQLKEEILKETARAGHTLEESQEGIRIRQLKKQEEETLKKKEEKLQKEKARKLELHLEAESHIHKRNFDPESTSLPLSSDYSDAQKKALLQAGYVTSPLLLKLEEYQQHLSKEHNCIITFILYCFLRDKSEKLNTTNQLIEILTDEKLDHTARLDKLTKELTPEAESTLTSSRKRWGLLSCTSSIYHFFSGTSESHGADVVDYLKEKLPALKNR